MDKFYDEVVVANEPYVYNPKQERPFIFDQKAEVYKDLEKEKPIGQQFVEEGKRK